MKANCLHCGIEFECRGAEKYCCKECQKLARQKRDNSWKNELKICPYCKQEFYPKYRSDQKYCSDKCRDKAKWELKKTVLSERICPICGIEFMPTRNKQVCCSDKCAYRKIYLDNPEKHREQSRRWRQNNPERAKEIDRNKRKLRKEHYKEMNDKYHDETRFGGNREKALERDGYKCVLCGEVNEVSVHHKDCSGQTDKPNHELDNLITLCKSCHTKQHKPRLNSTPHEIRTCPICGIEYRVSQVRIDDGRGKFCSKECFNKSMEKKVPMTCEYCGKEFFVTPSRAKRGKVKYDSMECRKAAGYAHRSK